MTSLAARVTQGLNAETTKARPGDKVAVVSPSFAAPGAAPAVHEQAMRRLTELTGLVPVEYSTTRKVGTSARERAADLNAAFGDHRPGPVRGLRQGLGRPKGTDRVRRPRTHRTMGLGRSGALGHQPHLGRVHRRHPVDPQRGPLPQNPSVLDGGVLLLESSEDLIPAQEFGFILRSLGERGVLDAVDAVMVARPPASSFTRMPDPAGRAAHRQAQRETAIEIVERYNAGAVVCFGVPFGHTRPQWILPYGGTVTVDGASQRVWADYS